MTAQQYGFWDVCRTLAFKNDILFFNGRSIAARFQGMSKSTAYLLADALVESGWFKLIKDSMRRKDGTFSPKQYRVLSHDQWVLEHPEGCLPVQPAGLDDISPVQPADSPVQPADQPVQPAGHNLIHKSDTYKPDIEPDNHKPFQPAGLDDFVNRFSKRKREARKAAAAPALDTAPVQSAGQAVRDTQKDAEWLSTAFTNTIGITNPNERLSWTAGFELLLRAGHSKDVISATAEFVHSKVKPEALRREGPSELVKNFDNIRARMVATNGGKTA